VAAARAHCNTSHHLNGCVTAASFNGGIVPDKLTIAPLLLLLWLLLCTKLQVSPRHPSLPRELHTSVKATAAVAAASTHGASEAAWHVLSRCLLAARPEGVQPSQEGVHGKVDQEQKGRHTCEASIRRQCERGPSVLADPATSKAESNAAIGGTSRHHQPLLHKSSASTGWSASEANRGCWCQSSACAEGVRPMQVYMHKLAAPGWHSTVCCVVLPTYEDPGKQHRSEHDTGHVVRVAGAPGGVV